MSEVLKRIVDRIASVSPRWRAATREATTDMPAPRTATHTLRAGLADGVETIYEGHLLHHDESRVLKADTSDAMKLLVGDYCYAAGLTDIADTGDVEAVRSLAALIADVSVLAAGTEHRDHATLERRWDVALKELT